MKFGVLRLLAQDHFYGVLRRDEFHGVKANV